MISDEEFNELKDLLGRVDNPKELVDYIKKETTPVRYPKRIVFELTMPGNNAWNGRWSGENDKYTVIKKLGKRTIERLEMGDYSYNFGDGWRANVEVREALPRERATNRFCGYEWMINSILDKGCIES